MKNKQISNGVKKILFLILIMTGLFFADKALATANVYYSVGRLSEHLEKINIGSLTV